MPTQTVRKWGNSPAVRIPSGVMEVVGLQLDQEVDLRVENGSIVITPVTPDYDLQDLLSGITDDNVHSEVDFGGPEGREVG